MTNIKNPNLRKLIESTNGNTLRILSSFLKDNNYDNRKNAALLLGEAKDLRGIYLLCNIALFDEEIGVRKIAMSSIVEISRESYRNYCFVLKMAIHPLFNSWHHFPTLDYLHSLHWCLSCFKYTSPVSENIIKIIERRQKTTIDKDILQEMSAIIRTVIRLTI